MENQGDDGSGDEAMDTTSYTDDHGKDTPSGIMPSGEMPTEPINVTPTNNSDAQLLQNTRGNVPITFVSEQSARDRKGIPIPSSSAVADTHAGSSDNSPRSQSPDIENILHDFDESVSKIQKDGLEQGNIETQFEAPADAFAITNVDNLNPEALAISQAVDKGDSGAMPSTESPSEFPAVTDDNNVTNEPSNDETFVIVRDMPHTVSGQQGMVPHGQAPSDTEEPLQLQLKVAHSEIERLKTEVERLTTQRDDRQSAELQRLANQDPPNKDEAWKKTCDALKIERDQMKAEYDRMCSLLEKDKKDLKKSNAVLAKKVTYHDALKIRNVEIMQQLANMKEEVETLRSTCQTYYRQGYNIQQEHEASQKVCAKLNHEKTELATYNQHLVGELKKLEEDLKFMSKENSNLVLRLSKVAGDRLTAGNPNIADLSDVHRPTKLAEDFSELYDNEWTDAFEEAPMDTEKDKVTFLFNLLKRSYELCLAESGDLFKHVLSQHASSVVYGIDQLEFTVPEHKNVAKSDTETKVQPERNDMETKDSMETALDTVKQTGRARPVNIESTTQDVESDVDKYPENSANGGAAADDDHEDSMSTREGRDVDITDVGIQLSDDHQQDDSTSGLETDVDGLETDVDTGVSTVNSGHVGDAPVEKVRIGVSDESRKVLTDLYKHIIMAAADSVNKKLQRVIAQELQLDYTKQACIHAFVSKCLEVSWLMVMQTPTVHINFDSRSGEKLERDKYKAFTVMGKTIDYIVWPSVYLHEGGPLLTKGIAQGLRL